MANKKISELPTASTGAGYMEIVVGGVNSKVQLYQAGYAFPGDALPTSWPVGGWGYATADRYTIGNPEYVASGSLIFRLSSGTSFSDFKFV